MSDNKKPLTETNSVTAQSKPVAKKASAKASRGLGRGLSSLLGDSAVSATLGEQPTPVAKTETKSQSETGSITGTSVRNLPVEWINPGPWQPRRVFDQDGLQELAASMRQQGVVQPILVRPNPEKPSRYQIIAGERRWRAAQIAQLHEIPALIRDMNDKDASEIALIENIQRRDLNVIEEARAYQTLIDMHGYKQQELSEIIGKSRPHITNLMRLLGLPDTVQMMVADAELIVYGATDPSARLTIGGEEVPLSTDGTFRIQVPFRDGEQVYAIEATAADGEQKRNITLNFERQTPEDNSNPASEARAEWF